MYDMGIQQFGISLLFLLLTFSTEIISQDHGAKAFGMAGASAALRNEFGLFNNPGAIQCKDSIIMALGSNLNLAIPEFSRSYFILDRKKNCLSYSLGMQNQLFTPIGTNEIRGRIAYSYSDFSYGLSLGLTRIDMGTYGSWYQAHFAIGGMVRISNINVGLVIHNPFFQGTELGGIKEKSPTHIRSGISSRFSSKSQGFLEIEKGLGFPLIAKVGFSTEINPTFGFQMGISSKPFKQSLGFYLNSSSFSFHSGFSYSAIQGWASMLEVKLPLKISEK